jgi:cytoskeleton protein RodZ
MEKLEENQSARDADSMSDVKTIPMPAMTVGRLLREGRERMELSVDDVVDKIKLAPRQIVALEADDFKALPETAFVRGFVRSYAKLLRLEAQPLLDLLPGAEVKPAAVEQLHVDAPFPSEKTVRRQNISLLIAALLIGVTIVGFVIWQNKAPRVELSEVQPDGMLVASSVALPEQAEILDASGVQEAVVAESAVTVAQPAPAVNTVAPVVNAAVNTVAALRLVFDKESWADIKDRTGNSLSRQVNQPGSELRLEGLPPFTMVIGHAASVHLYYRDKPVDLSAYVGAGGDVARMTLE